MDMRFYWLRDRTMQKHFHIYWEPGKHNLADLPTKHHPGSHHRRVRPIYLYNKDTSPVSIQGCIKLLSPSKKAQTKTQRPLTTPSPQISYLCQLSQMNQSHSSMQQAHAGGKLHASHKPSLSVADRASVTDRVHQIIRQVLHKRKQLSSGDNLLSSLY